MSIHVLYTPMHEEVREPAGDRWCFRCRKRLPHDDVLMVCDDPYSYYAAMQAMGCLEQMDGLRGGSWGVPATPGGMLGRLRRLANKGLVRELDEPAGRFVLTDTAIAALDRDPYLVDQAAQDVEA